MTYIIICKLIFLHAHFAQPRNETPFLLSKQLSLSSIWSSVMHSEPSFSLLCVCKSVQSGGFTLPNCFLKSHKRDLQNVLSLAKTEHIISPSDLMRFSITFEFFEYFLFEVPEQEFFLWSRRFSFKVLIEYIVSFYVTGSCFRCSIFQRLPNYQKIRQAPHQHHQK